MNSLNEPPPRRTQFPFHEIVDDLEPKPCGCGGGECISCWNDMTILPRLQVIFRNSITIDPRGELPMRQESTSDLSECWPQ